LPPQKKKKTLVLTNVGKRAVGVYYILVGSVYLKNSESSVLSIFSKSNMGMEEHTCQHSEPAGKGREKKKKKPLGINPGQPAEKRR
jgi:hypothetical protein